MNVLVDRHHAGLYRSMQLLAERFGWNLYTPVGLDWMTSGIWNFGINQGITADLANQYLVPHRGVWAPDVPLDPVIYTTEDPEFPGATIKGVTLQGARAAPWAYVIATLDDNQYGFHRFAQEVGAQYVAQVGNTGQHVAWQLDPLAIVSSEVPIRGRGVLYHQPMDPAATAWSDPDDSDPYIISSFVNCFPRIGSCYELWQVSETTMPDFEFREFGIDGNWGVMKPIKRLRDLMGQSQFGWHDKVHGDGFGHVIHGWAAVGRPIIGHAHHYRGKMAEHFWDHGRTCIDLDQVTIPEAVTLIRDIAADPDRHAEMCHAIRAEFDRIDWEGEAAAIADLLGVTQAVAA